MFRLTQTVFDAQQSNIAHPAVFLPPAMLQEAEDLAEQYVYGQEAQLRVGAWVQGVHVQGLEAEDQVGDQRDEVQDDIHISSPFSFVPTPARGLVSSPFQAPQPLPYIPHVAVTLQALASEMSEYQVRSSTELASDMPVISPSQVGPAVSTNHPSGEA